MNRAREFLSTPEIKINRLERTLIANRGEIAVQAGLTCLKRGIRPVVTYTYADEDTEIVRMAKEHEWDLYLLEGDSAEETYGNREKMLKAANLMGCDSVFLGYGFLSEDAEFAKMCEEKGRELEKQGKHFTVIEPPSHAMEIAGNKIAAREEAKKTKIGMFAHIPVLEGTGNLATFEEVVQAVTKKEDGIGFPVMLKDPNTGGGRGNRTAYNLKELEEAYKYLRNLPGNKEIFAEQFIEEAVHVEVQILADKHGTIVVVGDERDCSVQREGQKIIEESPSVQINEATRRIIKTAAKNMARNIGYVGAGTWEFIIDKKRQGKGRNGEQAWYFMEINPREQVERTVSEMQTDIDITDEMFDIAEGKRLRYTRDIPGKGHTIQARHYAEDPVRNFAKRPGKLATLLLPHATPNRRTKTSYREGDTMPAEFDHTIALEIAHGNTRAEAIQELAQMLEETDIRGTDISHNGALLKEFIASSEFRTGTAVHTRFLQTWLEKRLKEHTRGITEFINGGRWEPHEPSMLFDLDKYHDIPVPSRRSSALAPYKERILRARRETGRTSAAEHGIVERYGKQLVLYYHDYDFNAGSFGPAEGAVLADAIKLANQKPTFLVTVSPSGGADQGFNTQSLFQMRGGIHLLNRLPPLLHFHGYSGLTYGGVPASFAGRAHVKFAVDSPNTRTGFSGGYIVAKSEGAEPESSRIEDAYSVLPEGAHTPMEQFRNRVVHFLVPSLEAASDKIFHIAHILNAPSMATDSAAVFPNRQDAGYRETTTRGTRFDRPENRVTAWITDTIGRAHLWPQRQSPEQVVFQKPPEEELNYQPLSLVDRLKVVEDPNRPTAADLIDPKAGVFDDAEIISTKIHVDGLDQYPATIAAIAKIDGIPVGIIAHQAQHEYDPATGKTIKKYDPQKPQDWEYILHYIEVFKKLGLPLVEIIDTDGADCRLDAEAHDQSHKISGVISATDDYPHPIISINIGMKGSGGGETFGGPADASAFFENAWAGVSKAFVNYWIQTGRWIDENASPERKKELEDFIEQQIDSTAEWHRDVIHAIDTIIREGKGGAHLNPNICAQELRKWIAPTLRELTQIPEDVRSDRRDERHDIVRNFGLVPNTKQ